MVKKFYKWFRKQISKDGEKNAPSGGIWPSVVRQEVLNLCRKYQGRLLEVGCGEGLFVSQLAILNPDLNITGIDFNPQMLNQANKRITDSQLGNVKIIKADATKLPFTAEHFDQVVCINVFLNLYSEELVMNVLKEMTRVCKPGGKLIFEFRNALNPVVYLKYKLAPFYDASIKDSGLVLKTHKPRWIKTVLKSLGLKVEQKKYLGFPHNKFAPLVIIEAKKC